MHCMIMKSPKTPEIEIVNADQIGMLHVKRLIRNGYMIIGDIIVTAKISYGDLIAGIMYREKIKTDKAFDEQKALREELRRVRGYAEKSELPLEERYPEGREEK